MEGRWPWAEGSCADGGSAGPEGEAERAWWISGELGGGGGMRRPQQGRGVQAEDSA